MRNITVGTSEGKRSKKGCCCKSGACISPASSSCNCGDILGRSVTLPGSTILFAFMHWNSRNFSIRSDKLLVIPFCLRYLRNSQNCFISSLDMFRSAVIEALTLPMIDESATNAQKRIAIEKIRSGTLVAKMSIDAGVNCVMLQCKDVKYFQAKSWSYTGVSPSSSSQFFSRLFSLHNLPIRYQKHATIWFKKMTSNRSLIKFIQIKAYSLSTQS
mmetsp:Transcript_52189/g.97960  ORF Transcript_52189/g.97960 Transcript_52189/m.97960 type:complete len:215 (-) Transcript_52189:764-1408(-)